MLDVQCVNFKPEMCTFSFLGFLALTKEKLVNEHTVLACEFSLHNEAFQLVSYCSVYITEVCSSISVFDNDRSLELDAMNVWL